MLLMPLLLRVPGAAFRFVRAHWKLAIAIALCAAVFLSGYHVGSARVTAQWNVQNAAVAKAVAKVDTKQSAVSAVVQTKVVTQVKVIRERGQTIYKQVPFYVPSTAPALPGSFRVLYDAAATGLPLSGAARSADAAPVPAQDLARTDVDNLTGCRADAAVIDQWRDWAASEAAATR